MEAKSKILYIDDEHPNLVAFKAIFRRRFNVLTAPNGTEGISHLKEHPDVKVVISDQRMKEESGVEFFARMKTIYPDPVRIILTGFTDHQAMNDAINKANVYRFLTKPWNEVDLSKTIDSAIELYDYRNRLNHKNDELAKAYDELSKFVYSASHDMRAPLVSIAGLIELAKHDEFFKNDNTYLPLIERSVHKLDTFVKNIVEYYQNKEKENEFGRIDFNNLIDESIKSLEYYLDLSEINLDVQVHLTNPFHCDKFRLQVVLNNLISNGVKYQRKAEPNKQLMINCYDKDNGVEITITDNGIGVSDENINELFDMFYRATNQNTGSGIGLYIVKEAIKKLDGKIHVESVIDQGTTFTIFIPNQLQHEYASGYN